MYCQVMGEKGVSVGLGLHLSKKQFIRVLVKLRVDGQFLVLCILPDSEGRERAHYN